MLHDLANPTLRRLHRDATLVSEAFEALARGLSDRQLRWSPEPTSWSVAQCLEHLVLTERTAEPRLRAALHRARAARRDAGSTRPGPVARWLIAASGPDSRDRPLSCPRLLHPGPDPAKDVLERFLAGQRRFLELLEQADGIDLDAVRVAAPRSRVLRLRLGEALALAIAHAQRHLEQARRIVEHPRFPR